MVYQPRTHELGLFRPDGSRKQPRDQRGRFVRVRYSDERRKILAKARAIRESKGLPPSPFLFPFWGGE
jgi:hypothetical protein